MELINIQQCSPEWLELRAKRMTASHAQAILANGKGLITYIRELMSDYYSNTEKESFTNKHTERGVELEPTARSIYELESGNEVTEIGFVILDDYVGCSPDGLIGEDGLIEIKCPSDKVYFNLLLDDKIDSKYYAQMQMQMYVCSRKWCDYVVYNPNYDKSIIIKRVECDEETIDKLCAGLVSGKRMIDEIIKRMEK